ncbi:MAG: carbohydrate-binding protein [Dysgonamonadaceae bacterium]|jgi:hypothetical protein|nr:carbohydrate-binding protein [Dysgonamonadaceae bacterium]
MKLNVFFIAIVWAACVSCKSNRYQGVPYEDAEYQGGMQHIPGKVYCACYDKGGEGVAYHDATPQNHGSGELNPLNGSYLHSFRADEGVDISYTKSNDTDNSAYNYVEPPMNQLYVGWTAPGEWIKYTVYVEKTGKYAVSLLYTSNRGGKIALEVNDKDMVGDVTIASTYRSDDPLDWRQWHHWNVALLGEVTLKKGKQVLTLRTIEEGQMNYAWLEFELQ